MWNFDKLPEAEFENVNALIDNYDGVALLEIHNKYNLSNINYCCMGVEPILKYFRYGRKFNYRKEKKVSETSS